MKKILILLFFIFIATGCYDYKELNNLAIISGIALDYNSEENKYELTYEILNDEKVSDNIENSEKTYYVNGSGKTITDAFNNTNLEISKIPYYAHVKIIIISEEIAENHSKSFVDYCMRNSYITSMFYMVVAKDYKASTILQSTSTENKIVSESIYSYIKNIDLGNNLSTKVNFEDYASMTVNPMQDIYLPTITLEEEKLKLQGIAIFNNNNKIKNILSYNESQTLNILLNDNKNAYYKFKCNNEDDKYTIIDIYSQKIEYKITKNKVIINANLMAKIEENQCNYNLKDKNTYRKLNKKFNDIVNDDITNLMNILIENNSDVLGLNYKYYKDNNKTLNYKNLKFEVKTNVNINKNGLIFEVKNDNQ